MFASELLTEGQIYTRAELRERFAIGDNPNLENGVFQPRGYDSVWLFVTETKTPDRTQYVDLLEGDTLYWDGQQQGGTDSKIIEHEQRALELLVFYRKTKNEYGRAGVPYGFRYEGLFHYVSHAGQHPTHFKLERVDLVLRQAAEDIEAAAIEDERYTEGNRAKALVNRHERNAQLRAAAIRIHGTTCQGCGFSFASVYGERGHNYIQVHHLRPISEYNGVREVDPRIDMVVVCANCHCMIHRKPQEPLTLEQLQRLVAATRAN